MSASGVSRSPILRVGILAGLLPLGILAGCARGNEVTSTPVLPAPASVAPASNRSDSSIPASSIPASSIPASVAPASSIPASTTARSIAAPTMPSLGPTADDRLSFDERAAVDGWITRDDPVMGGRSRSNVRWEPAGLVFSGTVSLENNGGFASLQGPQLDPVLVQVWSATPGLRFDLAGDGKVYVVQVFTGTQGWIQRITAPSGEGSVTARWDRFTPVDRFLNPRAGGGRIDPGAVDRLALYILDKQVGPFRLVLKSIEGAAG